MRKIISHGTADQMLDAFQQRLEVLDTTSSDVESATAVEAGNRYDPYGLSDVKKYLNDKLEFYGNKIEMDFGDGLKLAKYLKRQGKQVNYCPSQETWSIPGDCHWEDCYFYPYEANLDGCDDDALWDGKSSPVDSATSVKASASPRKKNSTHGTADQMLEAFESKIMELEGSDVSSSTTVEAASSYAIPYGFADVKKYLNGKLEFYGDEIEMDYRDGLKLAKYLKKQGKQVMYDPVMETWSIPGYHWVDCYFYPYDANPRYSGDKEVWDGKSYPIDSATDITAGVVRKKNNYVEVESNVDNADAFVPVLVHAVDEELEELDIFDGWTWEQQDSELILTTVTDSDVQEYSIPYADLQMDESNPEEDVQYIIKAITSEGSDEVTSATKIEASDKSVVIPASAKTKYYQDIGGGFGDTNEVYSLEDLMIIWNSECNSDPTMSQYESFNDWWQDTKQWMKPSSKPAEEVDDEMFTDNDGVFGNPGDIISKRDMRTYYEENCDSDPILMDYNSFEDWWSATQSMLTPVTNSTSVESSDDFAYDWEINGTFEKIASKQVPDSDGFYTDYTMYRNVETGEYVFVFGDNDYYSPEDGNYDYECDSEEEAWEWYNSYNGFDDEDSIYSSTKVVASEELTPEGFYEFFSVSAEPELMDKAAKILYEWYSNEGEEYMPEYVDILDMCDAADDETEKRIVLEAMGEETYDWDDEDIDASCNCKVEGMTQNKVSCATIADNGEQVFQLMEYNSYPEAGIEGDDFYCYGEFFATDEDDALNQLGEAKSAYPKFANLADQAHLFVQPYNEHFSTGGEIYQNVSAIAQHLNQDFHDEEIPFA